MSGFRSFNVATWEKDLWEFVVEKAPYVVVRPYNIRLVAGSGVFQVMFAVVAEGSTATSVMKPGNG